MDTLIKCTSEFEERIGLRHGFFNEIIRQDDWSFVIKLHAFIEACLTNAICSALERPELEPVISRLDTSNSQSGKLAFARQLKILNKSQRRFIATLSELRNNLAHNVRSVDFSFDSHMGAMSAEQRYQFCVSLSLDEMLEPDSSPTEQRLISFVNEVPKFGIAWAASIVASELYLAASTGDLNSNFRAIGERIIKRSLHKTL